MEGLVNPNEYDLNRIRYVLWIDQPLCSVDGIWYVEHEESNFGIEEKIKKLDEIFNYILNALNDISYNDKENLVNTLKTKKNLLSDLLKRYQKNKKTFIEFDSYYRENVFQEYKEKYLDASLFSFSEKKMCLTVTNDIQRRLKERFYDFLYDYFDLRDSFFAINNYILKVKKLFNIET